MDFRILVQCFLLVAVLFSSVILICFGLIDLYIYTSPVGLWSLWSVRSK